MKTIHLTRANHGTLNLVDADGDLIGTLTFWPTRHCSRELSDAAVTMIQDVVNRETADAVALGYPLQERKGPLEAYAERELEQQRRERAEYVGALERNYVGALTETSTIVMRHENIDTHEHLPRWPAGVMTGYSGDPEIYPLPWYWTVALIGIAATLSILAYCAAS